MKIIEKHSHLNGEEYLIVHHSKIYQEINDVIREIDAESFRTKISKEKTMTGKLLYNPDELNKEFKRLFNQKNWNETRYAYYVTTDYSIMQELITLPLENKKSF